DRTRDPQPCPQGQGRCRGAAHDRLHARRRHPVDPPGPLLQAVGLARTRARDAAGAGMTFVVALGLLAFAWYGIQIDSWFTVALAAMGWVGLFPNLKGAVLGALIIPMIAFVGFGLAE